MNETVNIDETLDHCAKDALTGFLGLTLQAALAALAFTCLIGTNEFINNFHFL